MQLGEGITELVKTQLERSFSEVGLYSDVDFFYKDLLEQNYRYIILVPRKCLTEFKCIQLANKKLNTNKSIIVTPSGMVRYVNDIKNDIRRLKDGESLPENYLAVVDDILIYGRGIARVLDRLFKMFSPEEVAKLREKTYLETLIESNSCSYIKDRYAEIYNTRCNTVRMGYDRPAYRRASDLFIQSFYSVPMPNTSFVRSWRISGQNLEDVIRLFLRRGVRRKEINQNAVDYRFVFLFEEDGIFVEQLSCFNCIRVFYNSKTQICNVTPYVFLKTMSESEIDVIFDYFKDVVRCDFLESEKGDDKRSDDIYTLKYQYITMLLSDIYGIYLCSKFNENGIPDFEMEEDIDILEFTYGKGNVPKLTEIYSIYKDDLLLSGLNANVQDLENIFNDEEDNLHLAENVQKDKVEEFVKEYFAQNGDLDDQKAEEDEERSFGISLDSIKRVALKKCNENFDNSEFFFRILECMDSGESSLTIRKVAVNNEKRFTSVLNAGEQAYRIHIDSLMPCFKYLKKIEEDCNNNLESTKKSLMAQKFLNNVQAKGLLEPEQIDDVKALINKRPNTTFRNFYVPRPDVENEKDWKKAYHSIY